MSGRISFKEMKSYDREVTFTFYKVRKLGIDSGVNSNDTMQLSWNRSMFYGDRICSNWRY